MFPTTQMFRNKAKSILEHIGTPVGFVEMTSDDFGVIVEWNDKQYVENSIANKVDELVTVLGDYLESIQECDESASDALDAAANGWGSDENIPAGAKTFAADMTRASIGYRLEADKVKEEFRTLC
jgi:hypothetical protein